MADTELQKQLDDLKADLKSLKTDVSELARIFKDLGLGKVDGVKSSIEEELRNRREEFRRQWDGVRDRGKKTVDDIEDGIGQHPLSSVLTAFGVGFIIAKLMDVGGRR